MFGLGYQELLLILVIVLVLFGGSKLPGLAKSLGSSLTEFKKGIAGGTEEDSTSSAPRPSGAAGSKASTCAACDTLLDAGWTHCPRCGAAVGQAPAPPAPKQRS
jgi:sec-independent protein translocase protein TatA